jgi:DNA-directed RNA polymerase specialized sigma24 family protein
VVLAKDRSSPEARAALATLCQTYWPPLFAYIRRQVETTEQAQDLTQEFFTQLLEKDFLRTVDICKGRFRSFLLACCKHFLSNQRDRDRAQKRGGGRAPFPLDFASALERDHFEPSHELTAERVFERRWALTLLDQVLDQLGREWGAEGKGELFEHLKIGLLGAPEALSYPAIGAAVGMSENAVKKAAQRLRHRYRTLLREQIAATVEGPDLVEDEIRQLFVILGS